ncbi:MAG: restriction endonuclease [Vicinamibacterales bacterium]
MPTYDQFIEPILRFLAKHPEGAPARDVHDAAAAALGLMDDDRAQLLPSGVQRVYKNRAGWGHDRLKRAGLSQSLRRGFWRLTDAGNAFAATHPFPLTVAEVESLAFDHSNVRLRPDDGQTTTGPGTASEVTTAVQDTAATPDDRLETAIGELRESVRTELLEVLSQVSPQFFETIVLELLHRMGYGTTRDDVQRVGGVGDGGIDGVISLDRLGLEKVYVQAKRWQSSVGGPDVQAFYGALAQRRANKGVFITTSWFTPAALQFAQQVERIVLVDGARLADLMIEHEVGVTLRPLKVPKLDSDYFEE